MHGVLKKLFFIIFIFGIVATFPSWGGNSLFNPKSLLKNLKNQQSGDEEFDDLYNSVKVVVLKKIKPQPTYFYGTVEAIKTLDVSFNYPGKLESIKRDGAYVVAEVKDSKGKIVRPATIIANFNEEQLKQIMLQAELQKKMAEEDVRLINQDVEMMTKLSKSHAVSNRNYNATKTQYNKALLALKSAEIDYEEAVNKYNNRFLKAPFTGIVEDSYVTTGEYVTPFQAVARLVKIDTVVVKLELLPALKNMLKKNSFFLVYPEGENRPVKGWMNNSYKNSKSIDIYVKNSLNVGNSYNISSDIKKIYQVFPVVGAYNENPNEILAQSSVSEQKKIPLAVPVNAVDHDEKGDYIFIIEKKSMVDNAYQINYNQVLRAKKVYVQLGDIYRKFIMTDNFSVDLCSIQANKKLQKNDIVILSGEKGLEDGDKVMLVEKKWNFYPGQKVKVRIPMLSRPGYYVPPEAIISTDEYDNYVYKIVNGNKVMLQKVIIDGYAKGFYSIAGKNIKPDDQVVIVDDPRLYQKLYDGVEVFVKKSFDPSGYLQRQSVSRKYELKGEGNTDRNNKKKINQNLFNSFKNI